jgi:hypothetical protein
MLCFYADVPESAGLPLASHRSPRAILDTYKGRHYDYSAPEWITVLSPGKSIQFTQPRGEVADLLTSIATWTDNLREVCVKTPPLMQPYPNFLLSAESIKVHQELGTGNSGKSSIFNGDVA